jgi:hypothetical protein
VGTYSESGQRAKYRANGGLAARRSLEEITIKKSDLVGDSPQFVLVNAEELTAPAWHTAWAFGRKIFSGHDRPPLRLRSEVWRNSWQQ